VRAPPSDVLPRRSERLANKGRGRVSNMISQAQKVLLQKLGSSQGSTAVSSSPKTLLTRAFDEPLSASQRAAIRVLFSGDGPAIPAAAGVDGMEP
jgi:hypothetical protein